MGGSGLKAQDPTDTGGAKAPRGQCSGRSQRETEDEVKSENQGRKKGGKLEVRRPVKGPRAALGLGRHIGRVGGQGVGAEGSEGLYSPGGENQNKWGWTETHTQASRVLPDGSN